MDRGRSGFSYGRCARGVNGPPDGVFDAAQVRLHDVPGGGLGCIDWWQYLPRAQSQRLALCLSSAICDSDGAFCEDERLHRIDRLVCAVNDPAWFLARNMRDDWTGLRSVRAQPVLVVRALVRDGAVVGWASSCRRAGQF